MIHNFSRHVQVATCIGRNIHHQPHRARHPAPAFGRHCISQGDPSLCGSCSRAALRGAARHELLLGTRGTETGEQRVNDRGTLGALHHPGHTLQTSTRKRPLGGLLLLWDELELLSSNDVPAALQISAVPSAPEPQARSDV